MKRKIALCTITVLCFMASAYSLMGLLMVASLSGAPNYSHERAQFNANFWGSSTIIFLLLGFMLSFFTWRYLRKLR
jgi:cell division protein FtsW (lipid II flippase)